MRRRRAPRSPGLTLLVDGLATLVGSGGYRFLAEEMRALGEVRPDIRITVLAAPRNAHRLSSDLGGTVRLIPLRHPAARASFQQTVLPFMARAFDVLYCPGNIAPLPRHPTPTVLTIQDMHYFAPAGDQPSGSNSVGQLRGRLCWASARRATRVVGISSSLVEAILHHLPEVEPKLALIPSGAPRWPAARPVSGVEPPFLLSVANDTSHKHLDIVVGSWADACRSSAKSTRLVLAGRMAPNTIAYHEKLAGGLRHRLVHLGPIDDRGQLRWLYERASALITMSTLEAFPLTPGEAGSLGCPVIASDIRAHREVSGQQTHFVPPNSATTLARLLTDTFMGDRLPQAPWKWPTSWEAHARQLGELFDGLVS